MKDIYRTNRRFFDGQRRDKDIPMGYNTPGTSNTVNISMQ
jgi:hypothetical protein